MSEITPLTTIDMPWHTIAIGPSGSGKSIAARAIARKMKNDFEIPDDNIFVFCDSNVKYQWETGVYTVFDEWETEGDDCPINIIKQKANNSFDRKAKTGGAIIIFDDFNDLIPLGDKTNEKLYSAGRHIGIKIICVSHTDTSVQKKCRENIAYLAIMGEVAKKISCIGNLAHMFYGGDWRKMEAALKEVINYNDKNPDKSSRRILILSKKGNLHYFNVRLSDDEWEGDNLQENLNNLQNGGGPIDNTNASLNDVSSMNFGISKPIHNSGNMLNQNTENYNIVNNVSIKKEMEMYMMQMKKQKIRYNYQRKMKQLQDRDKCRDLILKYPKTRNDVNEIVRVLRNLSGNIKINSENYRPYAKKFLKFYFPDENVNLTKTNMYKEKAIMYANDYITNRDTNSILMDMGTKLIDYIGDKYD